MPFAPKVTPYFCQISSNLFIANCWFSGDKFLISKRVLPVASKPSFLAKSFINGVHSLTEASHLGCHFLTSLGFGTVVTQSLNPWTRAVGVKANSLNPFIKELDTVLFVPLDQCFEPIGRKGTWLSTPLPLGPISISDLSESNSSVWLSTALKRGPPAVATSGPTSKFLRDWTIGVPSFRIISPAKGTRPIVANTAVNAATVFCPSWYAIPASSKADRSPHPGAKSAAAE